MNITINDCVYECFYDRSKDYPYILINNTRKYFKKCDGCESIQLYGLKLDMIRQINKKSKCMMCRNYSGQNNPMHGKNHTCVSKNKISSKNKGRILSPEQRNNISKKIKGKNHPMYGKKHTDETKEKIRNKHLGKVGMRGPNHPMYGKNHNVESKIKISESLKGKFTGDKNPTKRSEVKTKLRLKKLQELEMKHGKICPNFNLKACEYFEQLNKEYGWKLRHALNGGEFYIKELGYWVDAYDVEKNIVVEYDEPRHYYPNGSLRKKDINRMINIINFLKCEFWRYNEVKKLFTKISLQDYLL
jgi:hypothetical protein